MKIQALIQKAEDCLNKCKGGAFDISDDIKFTDQQADTAKFLLTASDVRLGIFAKNHLQEIIDKFKDYHDALSRLVEEYYIQKSQYGSENLWLKYTDKDAENFARKVLEEK